MFEVRNSTTLTVFRGHLTKPQTLNEDLGMLFAIRESLRWLYRGVMRPVLSSVVREYYGTFFPDDAVKTVAYLQKNT